VLGLTTERARTENKKMKLKRKGYWVKEMIGTGKDQ